MFFSLKADGYIRDITEDVVGGGDVEQVIELVDGKVIVLAYGMIGVYKSYDAYDTGEESLSGTIAVEG